jgi:hypothetical protein
MSQEETTQAKPPSEQPSASTPSDPTHGSGGHASAGHASGGHGSSGHASGGHGAAGHDEVPRVDVSERGGKGADGQPQRMDRRLFMQVLVFDVDGSASPRKATKRLVAALEDGGVEAVVYDDANAPAGIGVLTYSDDPAHFVDAVRPAIQSVDGLVQRRSFTMLGRTYSQGHEQDLAFWLLDRPKGVVRDERWGWHVWYPLRRNGAFAKLDPREQASILREHAIIGRAYGTEDLAHDVRLACHGLDERDNEFIVGLIGKDLHPLSHVVQAMRKTRQTSEFIAQMGPFFVGRVAARTGAR